MATREVMHDVRTLRPGGWSRKRPALVELLEKDEVRMKSVWAAALEKRGVPDLWVQEA